MSYSPVEIRHVRFGRSLFGYRRGSVDNTLAEIASSYESVWQDRMDLTDRVDELEREVLLVAARRVRTLLSAALDAVEDVELDVPEDGPEGRQAA